MCSFLADISIWMSHRHIRLNTARAQLLVFHLPSPKPAHAKGFCFSVVSSSFLPVSQAKTDVTGNHSLPLAQLSTYFPVANPVSFTIRMYLQSDRFSLCPLPVSPVQDRHLSSSLWQQPPANVLASVSSSLVGCFEYRRQSESIKMEGIVPVLYLESQWLPISYSKSQKFFDYQ